MIPRRRAHTVPGELTLLADRIAAGASEDTGPLRELEARIAEYASVPGAAVVSSGRRGMTLILEHLGVGEGDEVIVPAYTLKDLIPLIQGLGAAAVPADIDAETMNLSAEAVAARLTPRTRAILALHIFGAPCEIDRIAALARDRGVALIEDCAHSLGSTVNGRQTGTFGTAAFFSFETTKPLNTFGGGMVLSGDEGLIEAVRAESASGTPNLEGLRGKVKAVRTEQRLFATNLCFPMLYLLATPRWKSAVTRLYRRFQAPPAAGARYLPVQGELGLRKLETLEARIRTRSEMAERFRSRLSPEIRVQRILPGTRSTWYFFVVLLPCEAAPVRKGLLLRGIDAGVEDEIADPCARLLGYDDCPGLEAVYSRALALPMFEDLTDKHLDKITRTLNALVG